MATDFSKMTINELKGALKERSLEASGKKADLLARLTKYEEEQAEKEVEKSDEKIIEEIDQLTEDTTEQNGGGEEAMEATETEEPMEEDAEKTEAEEGKSEEQKEEDKEENKEEQTEEKDEKEEPKKEEGPDYSKNAVGFVLALDTGTKMVVPSKDTMKTDLKVHCHPQTVLVYPITTEDLADQLFQEYFESCIHFQMAFEEKTPGQETPNRGYIEFIWASEEQATEQAELLAQVKEGITVKRMTLKHKKFDILAEDLPNLVMNQGTILQTDNLLKRFMYIGNLPPNATDQDLQELFPDATRLVVISNEEGLPKGYALAEFSTEEACDELIKEKKSLELEGRKLYVMRPWLKNPKGLLDNDTRVDILKKLRNNRQLRNRAMDVYAKRRVDADTSMYKSRLDKDCSVREELGLPVPPDVLHREEVLKSMDKSKDGKGDEKSGSYKRGGRGGRRGVPSLMRGGGGRGGNWGNAPYSKQGGGNYRGGGSSSYNQAVDMLMQVSDMLGGQSQYGGGGQARYGGNQAGYGGGYGNQRNQRRW